MGWADFGHITFNEDGDPILTPFYNEGPFRDRIEPIRRIVQPAVGRFLVDAACDLSRAMESGYRAVGATSLASSQLAARNAAGCRGPNPGPSTVTPTPPPFEGGQCPVQYNVFFRVNRSEPPGSSGASQTSALGPIFGPRLVAVPGGVETYVFDHSAPGGGTATTSMSALSGPTGSLSLEYFVVARSDGGPDNCGDLPGGADLPPPDNLPPPPREGDQIYSPTWVDIPIDDRDDNSQNWSVSVGPVIFGGVTGANFNVGDIPIRILPDWTVQVGDRDEGGGGGNPALPAPSDSSALERIATEIDELDDRLLSQLEDIERDLERIPEALDLLFPQVEAESVLLDCKGRELVFSSSGRGIEGLSSQISMATELLARASLFACPMDVEPALGPIEVLVTGVASGPVEFVPVVLFDPYVRATLVVSPGPNSRIYRSLGDASTGYFGYWGHGPVLDGQPVAIEWRQINTYRSAYDLPGKPGWSVWLNFERGVEYTLYGQKLEE